MFKTGELQELGVSCERNAIQQPEKGVEKFSSRGEGAAKALAIIEERDGGD